jgi:hypothetical protein
MTTLLASDLGSTTQLGLSRCSDRDRGFSKTVDFRQLCHHLSLVSQGSQIVLTVRFPLVITARLSITQDFNRYNGADAAHLVSFILIS